MIIYRCLFLRILVDECYTAYPMIQQQLQKGLEQLGLSEQLGLLEQLETYVNLLIKWNKVYNLTAITAPKQIVTHHIIDSLAVAPHIKGSRLLDVGTGGGFPGIPLALLYPDRQWVLLDAVGKKTRFLVQVKAALKLDQVEIVHSRVEDFHPEQPFDAIMSRAVGKIADLLHLTEHLRAPNCTYFALKGQYPKEELAQLKKVASTDVIPINVPGLDAERHLVII